MYFTLGSTQAGETGEGVSPPAGRDDPLLHAPEFRDLAVPMAGIVVLFAALRRGQSRKRARRAF